jgi:phospholipase/carboxylesterase
MLSGPERKPLSGLAPRHLVVLVHGYGANGEDLISLADALGEYLPDTYFIAPNAPTPLEYSFGGYQWFPIREISEEAMMAGVERAAPVLNDFIDHLLLQHSLTLDRVALLGFSQGTMLSLYTMLRRDKPCAGVVGFSGLLMGSQSLPQDIRSRPPVCLVHGTADQVVPFHFMAEAEDALKAFGVSVETHARPGLAHGIDAHGLTVAKDFLRAQLR